MRFVAAVPLLFALFALALGAALLLPANATASVTWSQWQPVKGTSAGIPGTLVQARAVSTIGFAPAGVARECTVDGVFYPAVRSVLAVRTEIVYGMVYAEQLADGPHNAMLATRESSSGYPRSQTTWAFDLQMPPRVGGPMPENLSVVSSPRPPIGFSFDENGPGMQQARIRLTVDGSLVFDAWVNEGAWTWTPTSDFANNSSHNVTALVTDASGNSSILVWSFSVVASPPMYVGGTCNRAGCHVTFPEAHAMSTCTNCHSYGWETGDHGGNGGDPGMIGGPPAPAGPCLGCHDPYGDHSPSTVLVDCASCHNPSWPSVPQHSDADTTAMHLSSTTGCGGTGCHAPSLVDEHAKYPTGTEFTYQCSVCHESANPDVVTAIANHDTSCDACHAIPDHAAHHDNALPSPSCLYCHKNNASKEHLDNCVVCHGSTDPVVLAAISAQDVACSACHGATHSDYQSWSPSNPGDITGPHSGYLATNTNCPVCHSSHHEAADGSDLLPTYDATCGGCHTGGTAVSQKIVTWTPYDVNWVPEVAVTDPLYPVGGSAWMAASASAKVAAITNKTAAGGAANGGGPHNDSALDLIADNYWDGTGATPEPSYDSGQRYGCATRRCHLANPHGVGSSKYKIFANELLFNSPANSDEGGDGTYGGLDAKWDDLGATDAAVERFVLANSSIMSTTAAGDILIHGVAPDANETRALVSGLTCGRPSNPSTGEDECHAEASYAVVDKGIKENRNAATGLSGTAYRTDNTGAENPGFGGNDNRTSRTGHVTGTFAAGPEKGSYAAIAGCTSCHDQTDSVNTVAGNFTFPHGQTPAGATNLKLAEGTSATGTRSRLWSGWGGSVGVTLTITASTGGQKAFDGQCLKCHRDGTVGIGLTK
jgi:hypothetical protein